MSKPEPKIIIASDSFKGSLESAQVADALEKGIRDVFPCALVVKIPVADGGEGTVKAVTSALGGRLCSVVVRDPLGRDIEATYGIAEDMAVMEMASCCGLPLLSITERNPLLTSTFGLGQMIKDALERGCRRFLVGIGGSATNDAGIGMMAALGARFLSGDGSELSPVGGNLGDIHKADLTGLDPLLKECAFTVACDVDTIFYGPEGAAYVFAPQKGADAEAVRCLDSGLEHFSKVLCEATGKDVSLLRGSGAAGGLGGGMSAFLSARLVPGIEMVLEAIGFDAAIQGARLILTGEGRMDAQTAMGKTAAGILSHAGKQGIPVIALTGGLKDADKVLEMGFAGVIPVTQRPQSLEEAMSPETARENLRLSCREALSLVRHFSAHPL